MQRRSLIGTPPPGTPHPGVFFGHLRWLDGKPLLDTIEPYRLRIFRETLYSFATDGTPLYNRVLCGRGKKNWKSADLILAALYKFLVWPSTQGNDCFILANDEGQAADDLSLAKKLITANPVLDHEVTVKQKEITRNDDKGTLSILPARDIAGAHGKTYVFAGFDEIHAYRNYDLFEALSPDPTRSDVLTWITSYAGIRHAPGIPLYDMMAAGKRGSDPHMYFSWYAGDYCTDRQFATLPSAEERANPSMDSWADIHYLATQKQRLPTHKYRRLHLNLPGAPDGAAFSGEHVMGAIMEGRTRLPPTSHRDYYAFVDMSGGSNDDAVLAIAHWDDKTERAVLDLCVSQTGPTPFNPRHSVRKFAAILAQYHLSSVTGDAYAGETFRADFSELGISYNVSEAHKHALYDALEPHLNAGEVELLDIPELQEQLLTLVWRGTKIDHQPGDHDDFANAAAGAIWLATGTQRALSIWDKLGSGGALTPAWALKRA